MDAVDTLLTLKGMPEEQVDALEEAERSALTILEMIGEKLEERKERAVRAREQHERRWLDDLRQYHGIPTFAQGTKELPSTQEEYRQTRDNITRPKVLLASSRLGDMLFPTTDRNWDVQPTPDPELSTNGMADTEAELVEVRAAAKASCDRMKLRIEDQFGESNYSGAGRRAIDDACMYGTGVIKGPFPKTTRRMRSKADGSGMQAVGVEVREKPAVCWVDLWRFFPDPARRIEESEFVCELHMMTSKTVRNLAKSPGFEPRQINRLLSMKPEHGSLTIGMLGDRATAVSPDRLTHGMNDGRYSMWEYTGPLPKEVMCCFLDQLQRSGQLGEEDHAELYAEMDLNELSTVEANVWFCQGIVVKAALLPCEHERLNYHCFNFEEDPEDIFGYGVPYILRDDQRSRDIVWQAYMLNTIMSSAPQLGVKKGALVPSGPSGRGVDLSCTRPKVWAFNDDTADIREAFQVFMIPNVTKELQAVLEQIGDNANEHTMLPEIAQGEPTNAVPTARGLSMLMNASNIVQRRLAKAWDDNITRPLLQSFYEYNMVYGPAEAKGDFDVMAKGVSHLLVKDVQANNFLMALEIFMNSEVMQPWMKEDEWVKMAMEVMELDARRLLKTQAEVDEMRAQQAEQAGQAQDPETIKAQAAQKHAEARVQEAQSRAQIGQQSAQLQAQTLELKHAEFMERLRAERELAEMSMEAKRSELLLKMASMESNERIGMEKILRDHDARMAKLDADRFRAGFDGELKAEQLRLKDTALAAQLAHETPLRVGTP
jgi:hypothetical protein